MKEGKIIRMTDLENRFCECYAKCLDAKKAYKDAYGTGIFLMNENACYDLIAREDIREMIRKIKREGREMNTNNETNTIEGTKERMIILSRMSPIEVASAIIGCTSICKTILGERECDTFSVNDIREIASHLTVYCDRQEKVDM